jgi:hypothetical protein
MMYSGPTGACGDIWKADRKADRRLWCYIYSRQEAVVMYICPTRGYSNI